MRILVEKPMDFPPRNVASLSGVAYASIREHHWDTRALMRIVEEPISVLRDHGQTGLTLLMGGYRVAMTSQEARALLRIVHAALSEAGGEGVQPQGDGSLDAAPDHAAIVAKVTEQVISWSQIATAAQRK